MFSVVIPLYNKENYIYQATQSVLDQSFKEFELIVINDGSTDNSLDQVNDLKDDRLSIISIVHSGVSTARNIGIEKAKFKWIALLDADDWWEHTFLQEIKNAIDSNPEQSIFATGRNRVFKDYSERYDNKFLPIDGDTKTLNYFKVISSYLPLINSSNVVISKLHIYEAGLFNERQSNLEDHDLWLRICIDKNVVFINKNLSYYRKTIDETASSD